MKKTLIVGVIILAGFVAASAQQRTTAKGEWGWNNPFVVGTGGGGSSGTIGSGSMSSGTGLNLSGTRLWGGPVPTVRENPVTAPVPIGGDQNRISSTPPPPQDSGRPPLVVVVDCLSDPDFRRDHPSCVVTVMQCLFSTFRPMQKLRPELTEAIESLPSGAARRDLEDIQNSELDEALGLLGAGKPGEATAKLEDIYRRIKDAPGLSSTVKSAVRGYKTIAQGAVQLNEGNLSNALEHFQAAVDDFSSGEDQAAALAQQGVTEIMENKERTGLAHLRAAYSKTTNGDLRSFIKWNIGIGLTRINGYEDGQAYVELEDAIAIATSAESRARAAVKYATAVFHVDPSKADQRLNMADAACRPTTQCTKSTLDSIEYYRRKWRS